MSNYIVDGSDLTSVADAIRAKSGGSSQLAFPTGFVSEIGNIPSGGNLDFSFPGEVVYKMQLMKTDNVSEVTIDCTKLTNINLSDLTYLGASYQFSKIVFTPPTTVKTTTGVFACSSAAGGNNLKEIVINGTFYLKAASGSTVGEFVGQRGLKKISGLIDLSNQTNTNKFSYNGNRNMFNVNTALVDVSFVPGTMTLTSTDWFLSWLEALSDDSLVSIANALQDTYSGTITFHSTPKAKLATIMGTVATVDGLSIFTKDVSGTVTLQDFLTTTKGATLA